MYSINYIVLYIVFNYIVLTTTLFIVVIKRVQIKEPGKNTKKNKKHKSRSKDN